MMLASTTGPWTATGMISAIVLASTAGEVLTAAAMKSIGDLDEIRAKSGMAGAIRAVVTCPLFFAGVGFLALAFFSLLFALNHLNLSLVAPASASLTLVTNAIAGKFFLHENVDKRRWTAAVLVCIGMYFLAH
ncbi:EamA family transporter [Terracidiphilus gabretensis]|uniref:EamA family transporter n=1 Tax=Terracidiphilus gabretensis TaxID=1577687 RepID=UPI000A555058|nr:EamA family transporter [Terracidiphilus gabretensis]